MGIDSDIESKFLVDEISGPEIYDNSNDAAALTILRVIDNNIEQCINELRESFEKLTEEIIIWEQINFSTNVAVTFRVF